MQKTHLLQAAKLIQKINSLSGALQEAAYELLHDFAEDMTKTSTGELLLKILNHKMLETTTPAPEGE